MSNDYQEIRVPESQKFKPRSADARAADSFKKARKGSALPDPYRPRSYRERQTARKALS